MADPGRQEPEDSDPDPNDPDPNNPDPARSQAEAELGAAVDEALEAELKRRRARFLQEIMGVDRTEGVGRIDGEREDRLRRDLDPDDPTD